MPEEKTCQKKIECEDCRDFGTSGCPLQDQEPDFDPWGGETPIGVELDGGLGDADDLPF